MPSFQTKQAHTSKQAFSLIELLVVIAIISALMTIGVIGMSKVQENSRVRATQSLLAQVESVVTEYKASNNGNFPDVQMHGSGSDQDIINDFDLLMDELSGMGAESSTVAMLKTINQEFWNNGGYNPQPDNPNDDVYLVDSWDKPIAYIAANGRGNGNLQNQRRSNAAYFVSAGPDGQWGEYDNNQDPPVPNAEAEDNIYSFEATK